MRVKFFKCIVYPLIWLLFINCVFGQVLNFNNLSWTNGSLSTTYNNIGGSGVNVTIDIDDLSGSLLSDYPEITNLDTSGNSSAKSLALLTNFSNTSSVITVDIIFSKTVLNASLSLWDIDVGNQSGGKFTFQDEISNLKFESPNGTWSNATNINVGNTVEKFNNDTLLGISANPNTSAGGTANITFAAPTNEISFSYGSGPNSISNPNQQAISIGSIGFSAAPEPSTFYMGLCLTFLLGLSFLRGKYENKHKNKFKILD